MCRPKFLLMIPIYFTRNSSLHQVLKSNKNFDICQESTFPMLNTSYHPLSFLNIMKIGLPSVFLFLFLKERLFHYSAKFVPIVGFNPMNKVSHCNTFNSPGSLDLMVVLQSSLASSLHNMSVIITFHIFLPTGTQI